MARLKARLPSGRKKDQDARRTAQAWLPYTDIAGGALGRRDGQRIGALQIAPIALSLLSQREIRRRVVGLQEAIQGLDVAWQILAIPRRVDLDAYITTIDQERQQAVGARARLLREYGRYVRDVLAGGEAVERRYYLLIAAPDIETLALRLREAQQGLERAGLAVQRLDDAGLYTLAHTWGHPLAAESAAAALAQGMALPMQWGGGDTDA